MAETDGTTDHKNTPGHPGYCVGDDGTIWSRWRRVGQGTGLGSRFVLGDAWHQMKPRRQASGHLAIRLAGMKTRYIHRLVLEAFIGPCPPGMECCHNDGDPGNNRLTNLRWDTKKANNHDRIAHGTDLAGERNHQAKLSWDQVREIRERYAGGGVTKTRLGLEYGVSRGAIVFIIQGKHWRELPASDLP